MAEGGATAQESWRGILGRTAGLFLLPQLMARGTLCLVVGRRLDRTLAFLAGAFRGGHHA